MIRARRRRLRAAGTMLTAAAMMNLIIPPVARAAPTGGGKDIKVDRVVRGDVRLDRDGGRTNITASHNAIIDYRRFNVPRGQEVRFIQPARDSRVLNRVLSNDPSRIDGALRANGIVYLVNPSGVIFGPGSVIDAGRLYAAAGRISDGDFLAGADRFTHLQGTIRQQGALDAQDGVALLGQRVINSGQITTQRGTVVLASGDRVYLAEQGARLMVRVDNLDADTGRGAGVNRNVNDKGGVTNHGQVRGDDIVFAAGDVYGLAVHNAGRAQGQRVTLTGHGRVTNDGDIAAPGGQVQLLGEHVGHMGGTIDVSGDAVGGGTVLIGGDFQGKGPARNASITFVDRDATILADALRGGDTPGRVIVWSDDTTRFRGVIRARAESAGGFVEVSGKRYLDYRGFADLRSFDGTTTGTLLLDPHNLTIRTAGPDTHVTAGSPFTTTDDNAVLTVASIEAALALADVLIQTGAGGTQQGDITLQNAITHPGGVTSLTIEAHRHINLNADINLAANAATGLLSLRADANSSGAGAILDGGGVLRLAGGPLQLRAGSGAGTSGNRIQTTGVTDLAAASTTGGVFLNNTGSNVHITSVNATTGLSAISSGTVSLQTTGDIVITSAVSSPNNVVLRTTGGEITSSVNLAANSLTLEAAGGITNGGGGSLAITTSILDVVNTTSGDIRLLETNGISVHRIHQQGPGATVLATVAGDIDLTAGQSGVTAAAGDVSLTAAGAGALISVNAPINVSGGNLSLTGANRVTFSAAGDVTTGGGDFTVTATAADIAMNSGTAVNAGAGAIALTANTTIGLGALTTTNATNAAVTLAAGGAINDIGAGTEVTATSGRLVMTAGSGIGSANALEINVASVDAQNGNNNIGLTETNHIDVVRLANSGAGAITLGSSAGAITIAAGESGVSANAGAVTLTARDGMNVNHHVTTTGGVITLHADTNAAGAGDLAIAAGVNITTGAGAGAISVTALDIAFGAGSLVDAGTGDITLAPSVASRTIGVGDGAVGQFHIDTTEMTQRLASSGTIVIGAAAGTGAVGIPALDLSGQGFSLSVRGGAMTPAAITMANGRNLSLTSNGAVGMTIADDLTAPGGSITLAADRMDIQAGALVTAPTVTLRNAANGTAIDIGSATDAAAGTLEIANVELGRIVADTFVLGSTTAGAIAITDALTAAVTPTLHLVGGSTVTQTPGSSITVTNLAIGGGASVTLTEPANNVNTLAISLTGAGNVTYTDADSFTVGTVSSVTGITLGSSGTSTLTATTGTITKTTATTGGGGSLALIADDIDLQAGGTINAAGGNVTLAPVTPGVAIAVGTVGDATPATLELSDAELDRITTTGTGTLRIGNVAAGDITLTAAITNSTPANLHFITGGSVAQNAGATLTAANVAVTADEALFNLTNSVSGLAAAIGGAGNAFAFSDADGFTVRTIDGVGGVSTNGGTITLTAGAGNNTLTNLAGATIVSGGADITITADRMDLQAGSSIDAGAARVTLRTATAARQIRLGNSDNATRLGLLDSEFDTIAAGTLIVGAANAGQMLVDTLIDPAGVDTLHLHTNSTISGAGRIGVTNLAMRSAGAISLDHASGNDVTNLAVAVANAGAAVTFANAADLTIGSVDGVTGVTTNGATITLRTLAVNSTFTNTANIASGAAGITLDVNRVDLQPGSTLTATGGSTVTIRNRNAATAFDLGSATDLAHDTIELSAAEIDTISAANLVIGRTTAGAMAITDTLAPTGATTLSLVSGSTIAQSAGAAIVETNLMLQAAGDVTLTAAGNDVDTLSATIAGGGGLAFTDADGLTVSTVNGVVGITTTGGDVALTAATGRITTLQALSSGGGDVTLIADQMAIQAAGTIDAGAGAVTLRPSTAGTAIDLGSTLDTTPGTLELSAAELDRITAGSLTVGDAAVGAIALTAALAPANTDTLALVNGASAITQGAGDTLTVANLSITSGGDVTLTQANDVDTLTADVGGALAFTDADALTLHGITTSGGDATITAGGLLTQAGALTTDGGDTTLIADRMALAGGTIDADTGRVTLRTLTAGRAIDLGSATDAAAALELSDAELNTITASVLSIGDALAGSVTVTSAMTVDGTLRLTTAGTVTQTASLSADALALEAGGAVALEHAGNAVSTLAATAPSLALRSSTDLAIASVDGIDGVTTSADAALTSDGMLTNHDAIAAGGDATLIADRMALAGGTVAADGITLRPLTAGRAIDLGSATDAAAALELSNAELATLTAVTLVIGHATAGDVTLSANVALDPLAIDTLHLATAGRITSATTLTVENLVLSAGDVVSLTGTQDVQTLAATLTGVGAGLTFVNAGDLTLLGVATNGGDVAITAGGTLANAAALDTGDGDATLFADRMALAGGTIDAGAGHVTLRTLTAGRAIDLGSATDAAAALELSATELDTITASVLNIGDATAGDIALTGAIALDAAAVESLHLHSGGSVGGVATLAVENLAVTAGNDVTLTAAGNDVDTLAVTTAGGEVTFVDADGFTVAGITTTGGDVALTAATGRITTLQALSSGGGDVTLIADQMAIQAAGTIDAGAGAVTLRPSTAGTAIDLGSTLDTTPGTLELSAAELDRITAGSLTVGDAAVGAIALTAALAPANTDTLALVNGASAITQGAGDTLTVANLSITSGGDVTLTQANDVDTLTADVGGALAFTDADALTLHGITTSGGDATITAGGLLTQAGALTTDGGDTTLIADRMALAGGTIDADTGRVTLRTLTAGRAIDLGSATDAAAALELSDAELNTITASVLSIGDALAGSVTVTSAMTVDGTLRLTTAGTVTQTASLSADALALEAGGAVALEHAGNAVSTLAATAPSLALRSSTDLAIASVDGIDGVTTSDAALTLTVTGTLATTQVLAAGAGDITLTADDVALGAAVAATGTLTLQPRLVATSIGVGDGGGDFSLTQAEIDHLADGFAAIRIGRADGEHAIVVGLGGATFADPLTLRAPAGTGTITIDGQLTGADDASLLLDGPGATTYLNADIVTAGGDITISDSVVVGDGLNVALASSGGDIRITGTAHSTAAATLTLDADTGDVRLDDTVTGALSILLADAADVTVAAFNTTGSLTSGNALTGTFTATGRLTVGSLDLAGVDFDVTQGFASAGTTTFANAGLFALAGQHSTSTGAFAATGDADLAVNITTTDSDLFIGGTLALSGNVALSTGAGAGDITVVGAIDGARTLALAAGTGAIDLQGHVGDTVALAGLDASAAIIDVRNVRTTGTQSYAATLTTLGHLTTAGGDIAVTGDAALRGDTTLASAGGDISVTGVLDGATPGDDSLLVNAGAGAVALGGHVGGTTALADLTVTGATISVHAVTTAGDQSYTGTTTLHGDLTTAGGDVDLHSATRLGDDVAIATAGGDVTFDATLNALIAGQQQLSIDAGAGSVAFGGGVGALAALEAIDVAAGAIALRAVTTTGDQTYTGPATLMGSLSAAAGDVRFDDAATLAAHVGIAGRDVHFAAAVDGDAATTRDLAITASRDVAFDAAVGGGASLRTLTVAAQNLSLRNVTTSGEQDYTAQTTLAGQLTTTGAAQPITFTGGTALAGASGATTAGGDLTFTGTLDGTHALAINLGTGDLAITGHVGQLQRLGAVTVTQARDIDAQRSLHVGSLAVTDARDVLLRSAVTTAGGHVTVAARRNVTVGGTIDTRAAAGSGLAGGNVDLRTSGGHLTVNAIRSDGADGAANGQAGGHAGYILLQPDSGLSPGGAGPGDLRPDGRLVLLGALSAVAGRGNNAPDGGGGQVFLAPFGRAAVPSVATIHTNPGSGSLAVTATGNISMGQNEKLVVPGGNSSTSGSLSLHSLGGDIHVGDLAARRGISITADSGSVVLLTRPRGEVLLADGTTVRDNGLDFYAGNSIAISAPIQLGGLGGPKPEFASKSPTSISSPPVGDNRFIVRKFTGSGQLVDGGATVLDIAVGGDTFAAPPPTAPDGAGVTELVAGASRVELSPVDEGQIQATALLRRLDAFVSQRTPAFEAALREVLAGDAVSAFVAGDMDGAMAADVAAIAGMLDEAQRLALPPQRIAAVQATILQVVAPSTATPQRVAQLVEAWRGGGESRPIEMATVPTP